MMVPVEQTHKALVMPLSGSSKGTHSGDLDDGVGVVVGVAWLLEPALELKDALTDAGEVADTELRVMEEPGVALD